MRLDELAQALRDFEECLVRLGVSRGAARQVVMDAEYTSVQDLVQTQADVRLLDLFDKVGAVAMAEREGVTRNTIYNRRTEALNRLSVKNVSRKTEQTVAQEAA
jgi:hypothetical protein